MSLRITIHFIALLLCWSTSQSLAEAGIVTKNDQHTNDCQLTLGLSNWLPYQFLSAKGEPSGIQIKLIQQIAAEAGCKLSYKSMTFPEGLKELEYGTIDFMMNATTSEERKKFAHFTVPYRSEFLLLYSTKKYLKKCHELTLEALIRDGFVLGVQNNLVYGPELTRIQNTPELNNKLRYVDDNVQHMELVKKEHLDGVIDDPVVVSYRSTVNTLGKALSSCPLKVSSSQVSLILSKKNVSIDVVERLNRAIGKIRSTAEYSKKWDW